METPRFALGTRLCHSRVILTSPRPLVPIRGIEPRLLPLQGSALPSRPIGEYWLGRRDLNPDKQIQSLLCYRYTTPQWPRRRDSHPLYFRFDKPAARLLCHRREIFMAGRPGNAPGCWALEALLVS